MKCCCDPCAIYSKHARYLCERFLIEGRDFTLHVFGFDVLVKMPRSLPLPPPPPPPLQNVSVDLLMKEFITKFGFLCFVFSICWPRSLWFVFRKHDGKTNHDLPVCTLWPKRTLIEYHFEGWLFFCLVIRPLHKCI